MSRSTWAILITALISLPTGLIVGFFLGVFTSELGQTFIDGAFATERPADVNNPKSIVRPHFALEYPRNWTLDRDEADFDIDYYFSID